MTSPWFNYPQYSWQDKTVTVIGAGIAGCQIAWHLAKQDWKVTVIEQHSQAAQEATGNLAGIISPKVTAKPSMGEDFYLQSYHYVIKQLEELGADKTYWHPTGVLQLAYKERERKRWQQLAQREFSTDFLQCLNAQQASETAGISIPYNSVYFPKAGWIEPAAFCKALLRHENIRLVRNTRVLHFQHSSKHDQWNITDTTGQLISKSEAVVICTGKNLNFPEVLALPNIPIAGQTSLAKRDTTKRKSNQKESNRLNTVIDHEGYITPIINNEQKHLFGATYILQAENQDEKEEIPLNVSCSSISNQQNLDKQFKHLPKLASELTGLRSAHAAFRLQTPDRFPYLGAVPDLNEYEKDYDDLHHGRHWKTYPTAKYHRKLFISAAYGSRGLTTAALCAKTLACLMNNQKTPLNKEILYALHPARFFIRARKRNIK